MRAKRTAAALEGVGHPPTFCNVHRAGYFDQPHLTRSVKHFIGQTPAQLLDEDRADQLSFLYKTQPFVRP
jgi:hypothetical protein